MTEHARLSPSAAHRWLVCPASLQLEEQFEDRSSSYAREGHVAHELAELKATKYYLKGIGPKRYQSKKEEIMKKETWTDEMDYYTDEYLSYLNSVSNQFLSKPFVDIERRVAIDQFATGSFGTIDCIMIHGNDLHIIDFKYGKGVLVNPEKNPQLMMYGLGAYQSYSLFYNIKTITLHIVQPRINNYGNWKLNIDELLEFGEFVKIQSEKAFNGSDEFKAGDHCQFCKAKAICRARAEANIVLAGFTKIKPPKISLEEVGRYLSMAKDLKTWAKDLEDYALTQSLAGQHIPGWKAVRGRSVRKIIDEDGLIKKLKAEGYDEAALYKPPAIETLGNLEKIVGKKNFEDLSVGYIEKPEGKPTLVEETDKRPAITTAGEVFKEEKQ